MAAETVFLRHGPRYGVDFNWIHFQPQKHVGFFLIIENVAIVEKKLTPFIIVFIGDHFVSLELIDVLVFRHIIPHFRRGALLPLHVDIHVKTEEFTFIDDAFL